MKKAEFRSIKREIRIIGFDDGSFKPHSKGKTWLVGVVMRGGQWMDGVLVDKIKIDGVDSTSTIVKMINGSRHKEQLRIILTSGITFAGFNVLDINSVSEKTGLPVIVVSREMPDMPSVKRALKNLQNWKKRWRKLNTAGDIVPVKRENSNRRKNTVYIQVKGMEEGDAERVVRMTSTRSSIPEPLRIAHLIATGISRGESVGRV